MATVLDYLQVVDPAAAARARRRYACFEEHGEEPQRYGYAAGLELTPSSEDEVIGQLVELHERRAALLAHDGVHAEDELFAAQQSARVGRGAAAYYREMFGGRVNTWNLRDTHMADTFDALLEHLGERGSAPAKVVVWAHNAHVGDGRAIDASRAGEVNLGQVVRERHGEPAVVLVGFTMHHGSVAAARGWGRPVERQTVPPALVDSYEALFHRVGVPRFYLDLRAGAIATALGEARLERAIGVVYMQQAERLSHYFEASLAGQFDAIFHFDATRALKPLESSPEWEHGDGEPPATLPEGL
jgi:erythromycin esterase-like protein